MCRKIGVKIGKYPIRGGQYFTMVGGGGLG